MNAEISPMQLPEDILGPSKLVGAVDAEIDTKGAATAAPEASRGSDGGLTVRTPDELLAMEFDPDDRYLDNGVFAKGQALTILGQGGVGKSRLVLQLAAATILGRAFLGMKVNGKGRKWLVLQAENSNFRLKNDMAALKKWVGEAEWELVNENLIVHTLEGQGSSVLSLKKPRVVREIKRLIKLYKPDVIVLDPLLAFAVGSLNNDAGMSATWIAIADLVREAGPGTSVVILHHALTGTQGTAKAVGADRASYGRGSKLLHSFTRGQINVSVRDGGAALLLSCGKNSNGKEFDPVGVRLSPSMIYEVDPDFDLAVWQQEQGMVPAGPEKLGPKEIADLVRASPGITRSGLVKAVETQENCSQATAYARVNAAMGVTIRTGPKKVLEVIGAPNGQDVQKG